MNSGTCAICCEDLFPSTFSENDTTSGGSSEGNPDALQVVSLTCRHAFHSACIQALKSASLGESSCPLCRNKIAFDLVVPIAAPLPNAIIQEHQQRMKIQCPPKGGRGDE